MTIPVTVKSYLDDHGINYDLVPHTKTYTCMASAHASQIDSNHIAKAVILKGEMGYTMAVIPGSHWVRLRVLRRDLNRSLDLAPEDELEELFSDCEVGAIPVMGEAYGMDVVMDDALTSLADVYFECGDHEQFVHLRGDQFKAMMQGVRHGRYTH